MAGGDEQHGDDDQDAEVLGLRRGDDHDEVQQVHQVVHGALHPVDHAPLRLTDALLEELRHRQVEGPQACGHNGQTGGPEATDRGVDQR